MFPLMNIAQSQNENGKMKDLTQMLSNEFAKGGMNENQVWFDSEEKTISEICQHGLLEDIKSIHEEDENKLQEPDEIYWTALHYASRYNQSDIIEYLVKTCNVDVNVTTDDDVTPLHIAVNHNCHNAVRCLLDNGADASMKNNNGECAIHLVGKRGDKELIAMLLSNHQTDLQALDKNHRTPLHHACFHGNTITCETLLNQGADLEAQTIEGLTPLHVAIIGGQEEIVKLLIKRAKERNMKIQHFVNIADKNGTKPLHLCARGGLLNMMEILLRHGADVNAQRILSGRGYSALHLAAAGGDLKMCRMLLNYEAELDIRDYDGCTPLHRAAARNQETIVTFLLSKGAALTIVDKNGLTCFLHTVQEGYTQLAELILKRDESQIYQRTKKSRCCVHLAVISRHKPLLMMLLRNAGSKYTNAIDYNNRTPLHYAAAVGDSEILRILLQHDSNPDTLDIHSQTPLHLACKADNLKCVKMILDKSMISLNILDDTGNTALHNACRNGNRLVTSYLLKHGADVSFADVNGDTALHCAVRSGCFSTCASLLDYYASCDTVNGDRETSLHEAAKGDNADIVVLLLDRKANTKLKNKREKTFLDLAIDSAHDQVLDAIMNHHSMTKKLDFSKRPEAISKILHAHPNVAIAVLDRGITCSEHSHSDLEFQISYDFNILDPDPRAGQPRFTILKSLVKDRQEKILSHPLVRKMLSHKWSKFGRNIYIAGLLIFIVFHFCLCWVTITERQYATFHDNATKYAENVASHKQRNIVLISFLFLLAIVFIIKEIFQMFLRGLRYFTNYENMVELAYYFLSMIFLAPYIYMHSQREIPDVVISGKNWVFGIVAVFLGWLDFVLYLRSYMFPTLGLYITMFFEILKTFTRIFSVIVLFLLGFASVFYIIFPKQDPFSTVGLSLMTSTVMMIGEIGYRETLIDTSGTSLLPFPALSFVIFAIFVVTMAILLANLLIGLAVGDIDGVQNNANMSLLEMLVDYVTEIEEKLPLFIQKRLYQPRLVEKPNTPIPRKVKIFKRLFWEITGDPSCESQQAVQQVLKNRFQKSKFEDSQKISRIEARINEQQRAIKQLKKLAQSQNKLLQDLTASLGLGFENEQNATIIDGLSTEYGFRSRYTRLH